MADETRTIMTAPAADPAPLGLAAFALTTFLLSAANAGWMGSASGDAWLGYAFAYGGLGQLLAGMWEFRNRNVFGATAFSTYGGFWIGLGLWALLVAPTAGPKAGKDVAWILLAFAIFNTYMLLWSSMVNAAVFLVFLTLEATEVILFIGNFAANTSIVKFGGYVGIVTALVRLVHLGRRGGQRRSGADHPPRRRPLHEAGRCRCRGACRPGVTGTGDSEPTPCGRAPVSAPGHAVVHRCRQPCRSCYTAPHQPFSNNHPAGRAAAGAVVTNTYAARRMQLPA